jgi:hypothetical protein
MGTPTKGNKTRVNFLCPSATVQRIEEMAEADHRDKSSMMNKIVDFYLQHHSAGGIFIEAKTPARKKAGSR